MDRNFARALPLVLQHEGGYVNHPNDPGGATNKGITLATFRRYVKPNGTIADLKRLTVQQAGTVYRRQYWDKVHGAELPDGVDYAVFDFAVNSGPARAAKYLQAIVGVPQDGKIGPVTLAATQDMSAVHIIETLCDNRLAFMKRARNRKTGKRLWPTFGKGWSRRMKGVREHALAMAIQPDAPRTQREITDKITQGLDSELNGKPAPTPPKRRSTPPRAKSGGALARLFSWLLSVLSGRPM